MIYIVWAFLWMGYATQPTMLAVPLVALLVRALYLDRWVPVTAACMSLAVGLGVVAVQARVNYVPLPEAFLAGARLTLSAFVLAHVFLGLRDARMPFVPARVIARFYMGQRSVALVKRRLADTAYSLRLRWDRSHGSVVERGRLIVGAIGAVAWEFKHLGDEFDRSAFSRGGVPRTLDWTIPPSRNVPVYVGDMSVVLLGIVVSLWGPVDLAPARLTALITSIRW